MKVDILTLFPDMFSGPFSTSMLKKAQDKAIVEINIHNLRDWAKDKHKTVDDRPYGGGAGMILRVDIIDQALQDLKPKGKSQKAKVILLTPQGKVFNQKKARELSKLDHLIMISGHYEGFDERVKEHLVDEEISIGDYILTGGEIPTMVIVDSVVRLLPGVLEEEAKDSESFEARTYNAKQFALLDFPQYTRPPSFKGWKIPEVLLSGNHKEIDKWRRVKALEKTKKVRPDLL